MKNKFNRRTGRAVVRVRNIKTLTSVLAIICLVGSVVMFLGEAGNWLSSFIAAIALIIISGLISGFAEIVEAAGWYNESRRAEAMREKQNEMIDESEIQ